jgi:hypothetical protein
MSALLHGVQFGRANPVLKASALTLADCAGEGSREDARLLPDPKPADLAAHAFLAVLDGGGNIASNERRERADLPSRIPAQLCVSSSPQIAGRTVPILRGAAGEPLSVDGRTRLLAVIGDAGTTLEVVQAENLGRYQVLFHQVGSTMVLGGYDAVPSDRQIAELLENPKGEAARVRVPVTFSPDGQPQMHLPSLPDGAPQPTT